MDPMKDPFDWVGKTIDEQFAVEEVVGEGGFAVVYRGHHKGFDEKVAIKALKFPAKLGEEERTRFLESFKSEGKLLRKLSALILREPSTPVRCCGAFGSISIQYSVPLTRRSISAGSDIHLIRSSGVGR